MSKFARLSTFLAAVVLFVSWAFSNTFATAAERDTATMDAVQREEAGIRQFSMLADGQRDVLERLAAAEERLVPRASGAGRGRVGIENAERDWVDAFEGNSRQLMTNADA